MTEKNLLNDNRQLRAKIHNLENENSLLNEKNLKTDDVVRVDIF